MSWIHTISPEDSSGYLKQLFAKTASADGSVDNILIAHSLRPASLAGHVALYKNVLHHRELSLPLWYRECIGLFVSILNRCSYCVEHHFTGMKKVLGDDARANEIRSALEAANPQRALSGRELTGLHYTRCLTLRPASLSETMIHVLRESGFDDGEILEINQIASYFNYANRTVLGLGINLDGDVLGLSPSEKSDAWTHV